MPEENDRIIETVDDEGNVVKFELIDIVLVEEDEYGILTPLDADNDEDNEAVIMRLKKVDEDFIFEFIEDDEEFQRVVQTIEELEELDEFDLNDDEEE